MSVDFRSNFPPTRIAELMTSTTALTPNHNSLSILTNFPDPPLSPDAPTASTGGGGGTPDTASGDLSGSGRRPLFVFPKRKVEDVPGIFIPAKNKTTEDATSWSSNSLLSVMRERPRRHSMGDPVLPPTALQNLAAEAAKSRPILLPRSPYSQDAATFLLRYQHFIVCM